MRLALVMVLAMSGTAWADLQDQVQRCWNPPVGAAGAEVQFRIGADGGLAAMPTSPQAASRTMGERVAAEAGIRAVRRCAPYNAPTGEYALSFGSDEKEAVPSETSLAACVREHLPVEAEIDRARAVLQMTITNNLTYAISSVSYGVVVTEPGRSVPWHTSESGLGIDGGIEPGETRTLGVHLSRISQDAGEDLVVDVTVLDAADADRTSVAGVSRFRDWNDGPTERGCP